MSRKPLVWKLFPIFFAITFVSVLIVGLYASNTLHDSYYAQAEQDLEVRAHLIAEDVADIIQKRNTSKLSAFINSLDKASGTRITLIDPKGKVIADSESNHSSMENHSDRPEFRQAIRGNVGRSRRQSPTLGITMVYVAIPIRHDEKVIAVLRTALAATALDAAQTIIYRRIGLGVLLIAILAGIASFLAAKRISRPLTEMRKVASLFASGDFKSRIPTSDTEEFANLSDMLNRMAAQLDKQVRTITQQATEQHAILSSMKEGVLAVDNEDRVLILNPTAERLLGISKDSAKDKTIQETIRNSNLQRFFEKSHAGITQTVDEMVFYGQENRLVQAIGTPLEDAEGSRIGVLVVLNDITQTRKLENMRKEFVANVSHELKTPITSIIGYVETLREGDIDNPDKEQEFLGIVARQADRLNAIIDDLLTLSKIEHQAESSEIRLEYSPVKNVILAASDNCKTKAIESNVKIDIECSDNLSALINPPLLEQAITNLIDNAIKYSVDSSINIQGEAVDDEVVIRVIDKGCGIESQHIPRLFERFYRIDKARSRKLGGTGLGLAIVKHIVQAHHGRIEVQSTPSEGSTFTIYLRSK